MASARAWRSCERTMSMAALARAFCELPMVFMTAKAITVKASATTTSISSRENPCWALLVRLLIPELLGFHPVNCRVLKRVHVPRQAYGLCKYIVFIILRGFSIRGEAGHSCQCNKTLQDATSETGLR